MRSTKMSPRSQRGVPDANYMRSAPSLKIAMINENQGGHSAFHSQLVQCISDLANLELSIYNIERRTRIERALMAPLPLPHGSDWDAPLVRAQIGQSLLAGRRLGALAQNADVVHFYTQNAAPLATAALRGRPLVVTTDGACAQTVERYPFRYRGRGSMLGVWTAERIERHVFERADTIVAQSDWAATSIKGRHERIANRVKVIRLGAPEPRPLVHRSARKRPVVVFVGTYMSRKGGWRLLEALREDIGTALEVQLVTKEAVGSLPGVRVRNDVSPGDGKIHSILSAADIFAFPSDMDMSPNVVFEAMANGLPVVAYRDGAIPEMVDDGRTGILTEKYDARALRSAIRTLCDSPALRINMGEEARRLLQTKFNRAAAGKAMLEVLQEVTERARNVSGTRR